MSKITRVVGADPQHRVALDVEQSLDVEDGAAQPDPGTTRAERPGMRRCSFI
jgi:hypothetical protein